MSLSNQSETIAALESYCAAVRKHIMGTDDALMVTGWADKANDAWIHLNEPHNDPEFDIRNSLQLECNERGLGESTQALAEFQLQRARQIKEVRAVLDGAQFRTVRAVIDAPGDANWDQVFSAQKTSISASLAKIDVDLSDMSV